MDTSLIVALVGVGGTLLASAIGFAGNAILENVRLKNERKTHMIKSLFDREYELYQSINDKMISMTSLCRALCNITESDFSKTKLTDEDKRFYRKELEKLLVAYQEAELILAKSEPFIQKSIYEKYKECLEATHNILPNCRDFLMYFKVFDSSDAETIKNIVENKDEILASTRQRLQESVSYLHWAMEEIKIYINSLEGNKNGR